MAKASNIDPASKVKFNTDNAIAAYTALQNAAIKLDEADYHLEQTLGMGVDMDRYYAVTGKLDKEMELKRKRLMHAGRLPKDDRQTPS
jgi:hypothetical protein